MLAVGIAIGSILASIYVKLEKATDVIPAGMVMGLLVVAMIFVDHLIPAIILLFLIGVLAGYFLVPLNSLLQHRGHQLLGAGHSIAVQNFNENIGILVLLGVYTLMVGHNFAINTIIVIFGLLITITMGLIYHLYHQHIKHKI